ncbi:hypothetical protein [Thalassobellus suaedae]|uniref:Uncharacterized protein n=1 Tax=Thalassobellus suaedae TaxID=3074124 RepID=A0ABY9Y5M0_9FLAO|nr:hypothetical protein RHP51_13010 [Flavobacteriaceae bacterium HL-DH14]WNH13410.1 hypothetical protein RHP49_03930 [Flavobacteriaceae bacterium HL-DH10]
MKTKFFSLLVACLIVTSVFSQANLNDYKYVIVPTKYDFLKESNQYQLNALTQFLFNKYGFETLMEGDEYPEDLVRNRCLALRSNVTKDAGLFKTKLLITLKGCNDQVVFTSQLGESREKEYNKAYTEAIRNAFKSFEAVNYKYEPKAKDVMVATENTEVKNEVAKEIKKLKEEIQALKEEKKAEVIEVEETVVEVVKKAPVVKVQTKEVKNTKEKVDMKASTSVLYAQEIENGFQLVDSSPKVIYKIKKTSMKDVFLVISKNGTLSKKGSDWILEYYENDVLKQEVLNIKF